MCGIVGFIDFQSCINKERLREAIDLLHKRGPDDFGIWTDENVGLGHRRLAILDLSPAGHQPMISPDGRYVIVFNGEIYNFLELRRELDGDNNNWLSHSDTEIIIAAYAKWGVDCVRHFQGMFAFAIWDQREKVMFAARDRMGVKPFYYHYSSSCFAFASRPRALWPLNSNLFSEIDDQALRFYLESGYVPAPYSIHKDIRKLPPAHYLLLDSRGIKIEHYWDFQHILPEQDWEKRSEEDLLDELDEIVSRAVRLRMISDAPLGAFLSGGIDSSLVIAMMTKHSSLPVKTFTIGFDETKYDESAHAQNVSQYLGTEHYCEHLKVDDLIQLLPIFQEEYDEPFFDSSAFPMMAVSRLARKHVAVSLSGDGGDELFAGYHYYQFINKFSNFYKLPEPIKRAIYSMIGVVPFHKFKLLSGALRQKDDIQMFAYIRSILKDYDSVLMPAVLQETIGLSELFSSKVSTFPATLKSTEKVMRLDASYTLVDDYLQKVDVSSMAFSLEAREPLLDHELVEWGMRLPIKWKLKGKINKYLLRQLVYRYIPENIIDRPKQGFGVPICSWLRGPLKDWARDIINDDDNYKKVAIDKNKVIQLLNLHLSGKRNVHPQLWAILMLFTYIARIGTNK